MNVNLLCVDTFLTIWYVFFSRRKCYFVQNAQIAQNSATSTWLEKSFFFFYFYSMQKLREYLNMKPEKLSAPCIQ